MESNYLKFFLKGKQEPFIFQVTKETAQRIEECLSNNEILNRGGFVEIEDISTSKNIYIKISCVQICQFLWDFPSPQLDSEEEDGNNDYYYLTLILNDRDEILRFSDVEPDELYTLINEVTNIYNHTTEQFFVRVIDDDGEVNLIKANDIILIEYIPNNVINEDEDM